MTLLVCAALAVFAGTPPREPAARPGPAGHISTATLHAPYPAGTDASAARHRFERLMESLVGTPVAHCDCPDLEPSGTLLSSRLLGAGTVRAVGDGVQFSAEVRLVCRCPRGDLSGDVSFRSFVDELRRLRRHCRAGRRVYCGPFHAYLRRFSELCGSRFSDEPACDARVHALRSGTTNDVIGVGEGVARHVVSFNMPCSREQLPDCERCVEFQMLASNSVESVGRSRCAEEGYPALLYYRRLRCTQPRSGPDPVYEAGCGAVVERRNGPRVEDAPTSREPDGPVQDPMPPGRDDGPSATGEGRRSPID